ncbi:MAG: NAD-dependent epimerase/dehydratase family protein [bacterium]|nr:NAD-dependent epimerase/dehydratase family protein [bacterium]
MARVLVTGGGGFIGSHLTEKLVELGHEVTVIDNLSHGNLENLESVAKKINLLNEDILNPDVLQKVTGGKEYIFHLAANTSINKSLEKPSWSAELNIMTTIRLLETAVRHKVRRVIFSSSASVYGYAKILPVKETMPVAPASPYALEKVTGENYMRLFAELYDIDTVSLRYFNVFGPRQNPDLPHPGGVTIVINQIRKTGSSQLQGDGMQTRDMIYVGNIVNANILAMEKQSDSKGVAYNICTGKSISIAELHNKISKFMKTDSSREYLPLPEGNIIDSKGDPALAKAELGFEAEIDLDEGLKRTIEWSNDKNA